MAARLHVALETYKIPKALSVTSDRALSPIFRDTTELTAHHSLSEKINEAVKGSRVLIVLCSQAAKTSHWVNEEIRLFRALHGDASILCVLLEGTPDTSFPPALLEGGREPLAANLGQSRESFRLGVTQLAASMLGVGLDTLIQRDTKRRRRRMQVVTVTALVFSSVMATTTFTAVKARKAAETNRMQAEGLVEYMITDLKDKLEPVGRLDILDSVGSRAVEYYDAQDIDALPDDSLSRQARARHILGQVALDTKDFQKAQIQIEAAARVTQEVYDRNTNDTTAIFDHAQSEYWLGQVHVVQEEYADAMKYWEAYAALGEKLHEIDPENMDWVMELGWSANNIAFLQNRLGSLEHAKTKYLEAVTYFETVADMVDDNFEAQKELGNTLAGLAQIAFLSRDQTQNLNYRQRQITIYNELLTREPDNFPIRYLHAQALSRLVIDGLLDKDEDALRHTVQTSTREYEALITQDNDNKKWRHEYYTALKLILNRAKKYNLTAIDQSKLKSRMAELEAL